MQQLVGQSTATTTKIGINGELSEVFVCFFFVLHRSGWTKKLIKNELKAWAWAMSILKQVADPWLVHNCTANDKWKERVECTFVWLSVSHPHTAKFPEQSCRCSVHVHVLAKHFLLLFSFSFHFFCLPFSSNCLEVACIVCMTQLLGVAFIRHTISLIVWQSSFGCCDVFVLQFALQFSAILRIAWDQSFVIVIAYNCIAVYGAFVCAAVPFVRASIFVAQNLSRRSGVGCGARGENGEVARDRIKCFVAAVHCFNPFSRLRHTDTLPNPIRKWYSVSVGLERNNFTTRQRFFFHISFSLHTMCVALFFQFHCTLTPTEQWTREQ